jgi:mono/diheme cytochrome c family protein
MKEIKAYKEAFPAARVKCATCHMDGMPKTGAASFNDYGKAVIAANPHPTVATFKKLGRAENFKK